ncbi:MAG: DUF58 domain-containing protein [Armatimonadetes bacterium]|nr:DUF58 domain-containing protein [Armatimonadota bacterium]
MAVSVDQFILDPREFRLLDGLRLNPRKPAPGRVRGERLTKRKGISIEFADYRDYTEGDDLRHLDWNILARLGIATIKTYQDEEDLAVHLLLDATPSMDFGTPSKFVQARRLGCALAYVAVCGTDAVYPLALGCREEPKRAHRGRSGYRRLAAWAAGVSPEGKAGVAESLRLFASGNARPGLAVILSDGLDPKVTAALRTVAGRGHEIAFVQVLSNEELDPDLEGDLRLVDSEDDAIIEITAHGQTLREYRKRLEKHCTALAVECRRLGGRFLQVRNTDSLPTVMADGFKREGWVTAWTS